MNGNHQNEIKTFDDAKFKAFEQAIDDQFERFHAGMVSHYNMVKWLMEVCAFTKASAKAEIRDQIRVKNFVGNAEVAG